MDIIIWLIMLFILASLLMGQVNSAKAGIAETDKQKRGQKAIEVLDYARYSASEKKLYLYKKGKAVADLLTMHEYTIDNIKEKPKEYIYTGVTVGGITTGGVSEVGGYKYIANTSKTGKYMLTYADNKPISAICLTDELFREALNSNIAQYLDRDHKAIRIVTKVNMKMTNVAASTGNTDLYSYYLQRDTAEALPDYSKCMAIKDWVAGTNEQFDNFDINTQPYNCPTCGAPIKFQTSKCDSCGQAIVWQ